MQEFTFLKKKHLKINLKKIDMVRLIQSRISQGFKANIYQYMNIGQILAEKILLKKF